MSQYKNALVTDTSPFAVAEAFKEIRTKMLYTARGDKCPIYAVTSAFSHAGKSVVIANMARSFAELGKHVLLIDCDMRNPVQHKIFGLDRSAGISEVAAGLCRDDDGVILSSGCTGLEVVTAGHIPPNPTELLASENYRDFLLAMRERYDAIFLDFPPIGVVIDAVVPVELITGYAVVVRSGKDDKRGISDLLATLQRVNAKVLGFVVNDVNPKLATYRNASEKYKYKYKYRYNYTYSNRAAEMPAVSPDEGKEKK